MPRLKTEECLYIRSMGKALRVTAVFSCDDEANIYMMTHRDEGVVAIFADRIYLANLHDHGVAISDTSRVRASTTPP